MLTVMQGDCRDRLRELADESVHCCVTSPPYWGLRDYGTAQWEGGNRECDHKSGRFERGGLSSKQASNNGSGGDEAASDCPKCGATRIDSQLGLEPTPEAYVATMVEVFREVRRVLRSDGTLWLNMGDSYATGTTADRQPSTGVLAHHTAQDIQRVGTPSGLKTKDLVGIPWLVAFALRADGWYLRSEIIWHKPNPMPESVTDRPTKSHEQVFLLTKSSKYFYDAEAIKEASIDPESLRPEGRGPRNNDAFTQENGKTFAATRTGFSKLEGATYPLRNKRSVWTVATAPYSDAHFATFPPKLIEPCVLAGTSARGCCSECGAPWERVVERTKDWREDAYDDGGRQTYRQGSGNQTVRPSNGGMSFSEYATTGWQPTCTHDTHPVACTILDPFAGSGTVGKVALEYGRRAILIELNAKYCEMIRKRTNVTLGLPGLA